jgi:hypothetical protein
MSHMQPEITTKQRGWSVETSDAGTCFVPGDVLSVPSWLVDNATFINGADSALEQLVYDALRDELADYVEGRTLESISVCRGYFARLSAPGYLDCTEWCCYSTIKEAREALRDGD